MLERRREGPAARRRRRTGVASCNLEQLCPGRSRSSWVAAAPASVGDAGVRPRARGRVERRRELGGVRRRAERLAPESSSYVRARAADVGHGAACAHELAFEVAARRDRRPGRDPRRSPARGRPRPVSRPWERVGGRAGSGRAAQPVEGADRRSVGHPQWIEAADRAPRVADQEDVVEGLVGALVAPSAARLRAGAGSARRGWRGRPGRRARRGARTTRGLVADPVVDLARPTHRP